jgi:hypothetical protein
MTVTGLSQIDIFDETYPSLKHSILNQNVYSRKKEKKK